jgi:chromosomal replication initiation ATPase DnaA
VAIHLIKLKCGLSVNSLASMFGRDHSTVTALITDFNAKKDLDEKIMSDLNDLYGKLGIK